MEKVFLTGTALLIACLCSLSVQAETYTDDCQKPLRNEVKQYSGSWLAVENFGDLTGWSGCGDATALSATSREAYVEYQISGADRVRVALYADFGTFALPAWAENGQLAFQLGSAGAVAPSPILRCLYDSAGDVVFLQFGGGSYTLQSEPDGLRFRPSYGELPAAKDFYGLQLSCSADGLNYTALENVQLLKARSQAEEGSFGNYYAETYGASLPKDTAFVRVALRSFEKIPGVSGWMDYVRGTHLLLLSRVEIAGETLQLGPPPEPPAPSSSDPSPSSSSSTSSTSSTSSVAPDREQTPHSKRKTHNRWEIALGETLTPGATYHAKQPTPPEQPIPPASSRAEKAPALSREPPALEAPFSEPEKERPVLLQKEPPKRSGVAVAVGNLGVLALLLLVWGSRRRRR